MTEKLKGKVTLVTGASSGIGRATALAFAREGAKVIVADVVIDGGHKTVQMVKQAGGEATFIATDVTKAAEVEALINTAVKTYGQLNCAHNNAGIRGLTAPTVETTEENWNRIMNVNLKGVWLCMKYEILQMLRQGGGAIVNTSSIGGLVGLPNNPAYVASKHGVTGLTKAAALEYARQGIRVNAVCPGTIQTQMTKPSDDINLTPLGRKGYPEEVAEAVVWLCSDAASFVTGHMMSVDGGLCAQ